MNEQFASEPRFARDEVVVNVDALLDDEWNGHDVLDHVERASFELLAVRPSEGQSPGQIAQVRVALLRADVEPRKIIVAVDLSRASVMRRDGRAEPSRPGVHEQPERPLCVAIELEEVIAAPKRPEVPRHERLARVVQGPRGKRRLEERAGNSDSAPSMRRVARRDRAAKGTDDLLERSTIERPRVVRDPTRGHPAPEIASESARHDGVLRREHAPDGYPVGHVCVRHSRDELHDVTLARKSLQLPDRLRVRIASPEPHRDALPALRLVDDAHHGAPPPPSGGARPSKTKRRSGTRFISMASARRARRNGVARSSARSIARI
jgi:hypothetical protein